MLLPCVSAPLSHRLWDIYLFFDMLHRRAAAKPVIKGAGFEFAADDFAVILIMMTGIASAWRLLSLRLLARTRLWRDL